MILLQLADGVFDLMIRRLFLTNILSVIILLYFLSSFDGYICCTLNEFALFGA